MEVRLLKISRRGDITLERFAADAIPPYAILSHTWIEGEEVTFEDMGDGRWRDRRGAGCQKIIFCGEQARGDRLQYFWVDTCCIDKSSSAELQEAINSMFQWYRRAKKCYIYLSDVAIGSCVRKDPPLQQRWQLAFRRSRWFTRGWTLQELLAPTLVEFFSAEGERLGDRKSMVREIQETTGICTRALLGSPLSGFSIDERMSWAERRETKREEDAAYALLGIFDIHMPLLYGEGREKAFTRLWKEIKESLESKTHAPSPALSLQPPKRRRDDDGETQGIQRNVVCYKCGEPGHYANAPDCFRCDKHGHLANELHCYKCGEYGHYADEPHCYRCDSQDHLASSCPA